MFRHLLVPLDGSRLAETVLPVVVTLARLLSARVTLFHAVEERAPASVHRDRHITTIEEGRAYLAEVAGRVFPAQTVVDQHVHTSRITNVAQSIVAHAEELDADLIAMCTHGQGTLRTRILGSKAQETVALGMVPVLLVGSEPPRPDFACRRLLVPLDGNHAHEQGLVSAVGLALACDAEVQLLAVIPTLNTLRAQEAAAGRFLPQAMTALLDGVYQESVSHQRRHLEELEAQGVRAYGIVGRGDAADVIIRAAQEEASDLIVMATHGRDHMDAFWSGSVTPQVVSRSSVPLLLVPVTDELQRRKQQ